MALFQQLVFCLYVLGLHSIVLGKLTFEPVNALIKQGKPASLSCRTDSDKLIEWYWEPWGSNLYEPVYSNNKSVSSKYAVHPSDRWYNITIQNVTFSDSGLYRCRDNNGFEPYAQSSAELVVIDEQGLQCRHTLDLCSERSLMQKKVNITCSLRYAGNISVTLDWVGDGPDGFVALNTASSSNSSTIPVYVESTLMLESTKLLGISQLSCKTDCGGFHHSLHHLSYMNSLGISYVAGNGVCLPVKNACKIEPDGMSCPRGSFRWINLDNAIQFILNISPVSAEDKDVTLLYYCSAGNITCLPKTGGSIDNTGRDRGIGLGLGLGITIPAVVLILIAVFVIRRKKAKRRSDNERQNNKLLKEDNVEVFDRIDNDLVTRVSQSLSKSQIHSIVVDNMEVLDVIDNDLVTPVSQCFSQFQIHSIVLPRTHRAMVEKFLRELQTKNDYNVYKALMSSLNETRQKHVALLLDSTEIVDASDDIYRLLEQKHKLPILVNYGSLGSNLVERKTLKFLYDKCVLTERQKRRVLNRKLDDEKLFCLVSIILRKSVQDYNNFLEVIEKSSLKDSILLEKLRQPTGDIIAGAMSHSNENQLQQHKKLLKEKLDVRDIITSLLESGYFAIHEIDEILAEDSADNQVEILIKMLLTKSDQAYLGFLAALLSSGQQHVAALLKLSPDEAASLEPETAEKTKKLEEKENLIEELFMHYQYAFIVYLSSESVITVNQSKRIQANDRQREQAKLFKEILMRRSYLTFHRFLRVIDRASTILDPTLYQISSVPMTDDHRRKLETSTRDLIEIVDILAISNISCMQALMNSDETIKNKDNSSDMVQSFLAILMQQDDTYYYDFIDALNESHQYHVVDLLGELVPDYTPKEKLIKLTKEQKDILSVNIRVLITRSDTQTILYKLSGLGVISFDNHQRISFLNSNYDKWFYLICILSRMSSWNYNQFFQVLNQDANLAGKLQMSVPNSFDSMADGVMSLDMATETIRTIKDGRPILNLNPIVLQRIISHLIVSGCLTYQDIERLLVRKSAAEKLEYLFVLIAEKPMGERIGKIMTLLLLVEEELMANIAANSDDSDQDETSELLNKVQKNILELPNRPPVSFNGSSPR